MKNQCKYCQIRNGESCGELFDLSKNIDGGKQNFEICLFDSPEDEGFVIDIGGVYTDIRIDINYCPMCGRKLR